MIRRLLACLAAAALLAGCSSKGTEPPADLDGRIAAFLQARDGDPWAIGINRDSFGILLGTDSHPNFAMWTAEPGYGATPVALDPLVRPATPSQFDVGALRAAIAARGSECDASGYLAAIGSDGPPLIVTRCAEADAQFRMSIGETAFTSKGDWLSADALTFVGAYLKALGDPPVAKLAVTHDAANIWVVPDLPSPRFPCGAVQVSFGDAAPIAQCDPGFVPQSASALPRFSAAPESLPADLAAATSGKADAIVELAWTDDEDPKAILQAGDAEAHTSLPVDPADAEAAKAHDSLAAISVDDWPEAVGEWTGGGRPIASSEFEFYNLAGPDGYVTIEVTLSRFGAQRWLPIGDASMTPIAGARCGSYNYSLEVACITELGGGAYLVGKPKAAARYDVTLSQQADEVAKLLVQLKPLLTTG